MMKIEPVAKFSSETTLYANEKTPTTQPPTCPLKVQEFYIKKQH